MAELIRVLGIQLPSFSFSQDDMVVLGGWAAVATLSAMGLFGPFLMVRLILYSLALLAGLFSGLVVVLSRRREHQTAIPAPARSSKPPPNPFGIDHLLAQGSPSQPKRLDPRVTGAPVIDDVLQEVLQLMLRDYVEYWYKAMADDDTFLIETKRLIQVMLVELSVRCKAVSMTEFITTTVIEIVSKQLALYRKASADVDKSMKKEHKNVLPPEELKQRIEQAFFKYEKAHATVCLKESAAMDYYRDVSEALLYLLLPSADFDCTPLRHLFRELLATCTLYPTFEMVSDPDYINSFPAVLIQDDVITFQSILELIDASSDLEELEVVRCNIAQAIAERTSSAESSKHATYKNQMESLLFAKQACEDRRKHLQGVQATPAAAPKTDDNIPQLPMRFVLKNSTTMTYFQEYMTEKNALHVLDCWADITHWRNKAVRAKAKVDKEDTAAVAELNKRIIAAALKIFYQYLADEAGESQVHLPLADVTDIHTQLSTQELSLHVYDSAHVKIQEMIAERYYPGFLRSDPYHRCLYTIKFDEKLSSFLNQATTSSEAKAATPSTPTTPTSPEDNEKDEIEGWWTAKYIGRHHVDDGTKKGYTAYELEVSFTSKRTGNCIRWRCRRRYSDFDNFNALLKDKYPTFTKACKLALPGKKLMGRMNEDFLDKRSEGLVKWLEVLMSHDFFEKSLDIKKTVSKFLKEGQYEKRQSSLASKLLLRNRTVSGSSGSDGDGMDDFDINSAEIDTQQSMLKVLLSLADVIFELNANPWLRRRVMGMLSTLVTATFGNSINKKVTAAVDGATSTEAVAGWTQQFRDNFWPNNILAPEYAPRSQEARARSRTEARAKLLGSLPDELKRIIGQETAKKGVLKLMDMLQQPALTKRLMFCLLEAFLIKIFPDNKFKELFAKLHDH